MWEATVGGVVDGADLAGIAVGVYEGGVDDVPGTFEGVATGVWQDVQDEPLI